MAHHTRIRAPGLWTDFSVLLAAEMELFDQRQFADVDGDAGGTWAPAAPIIVGGSGMHVTGPLTADDLDGTIGAGKTLTVDANGTIAVGPGTLGNEAEVIVDQYANVTWKNGGTAKFQNGTTALFESGATLHAQSGGVVQLDSGSNLTAAGSITFPNGSSLTQGAAAVAQLSGVTSIESGGSLTVKSGATLAVAAGSTNTNASVLGVQLTGTAPAVTADPGANNIAIGLNQNKGWGALLSDGAGNVTCPRGMNVASVAISPTGAGWTILFARAMDSNDYSIVATYRAIPAGPGGRWFPYVTSQSSVGFTVDVYKNDDTAAVITTEKHGCGFQIEAKQ